MILPFIFIANSALGLAFIKGHELTKNLPLINALQAFIIFPALTASMISGAMLNTVS